ncbi:MAG: hypothetical protein AB8I08_26910 [Sandaracinaceae bacterium]
MVLGRREGLLLSALLLVACDPDPTPDPPASDGGALDAGRDSTVSDAGPPVLDAGPRRDAGPLPDAGPPPDWPDSRAWEWVRENPMFISALTVRMGEPPAPAVDGYFDGFGANAIHLWETALPTELAGWHAHRPGARWLTWVHSDGTNRNNGMVAGGVAPGLDGRIGYQIGDEPVTSEAMNEILGGLATIAAFDPGGLRVVNFSYERAPDIVDYTDRYCASGMGDVISYDLYSRSNRHYEQLAFFRDVGLRCGMPYWRFIKGYIGGADDEIQSESDMRWAAFIGLTYGYTGHSWFLYLVGGGGAEGIPSTFFTDTESWTSGTTPRFALAAQINAELEVYGRTVTQLLSTDVGWATDTPIAGAHPPEGAPLFNNSMDPYLSDVTLEGRLVDALLGFFVDVRGDRYVIVQNPNHTEGSFPTEGDDRLRGTLTFDFAGAPPTLDTGRVHVLNGQTGVVEDRALSAGSLSVDLAAGDLMLFKYATGRPFAGYE